MGATSAVMPRALRCVARDNQSSSPCPPCQDFGDWSDLWREQNATPDGIPFSALLTARDEVSRMRLVRCLVQVWKV